MSLTNIVEKLVDHLITQSPQMMARQLEQTSPDDAAAILSRQPITSLLAIWNHLVPSVARAIFKKMPDHCATALLTQLEPQVSAALLRGLTEKQQTHYLAPLDQAIHQELTELLAFSENSAGGIMNPRMMTCHQDTLVKHALLHIKQHAHKQLRYVYLLDDEHQVTGRVELNQLLWAHSNDPLSHHMSPIPASGSPFDPQEVILALMEAQHIDELPMIDVHGKLVGIMDIKQLIDTVKETLATDMQRMVGVSKDENALSSSIFSVKKRLPWLQINLLTAFLAASVVGLFENIIAQFTALAVLLPVVAGQSGNAGAQALAVTMRGLTLREITLRHWCKVMIKEIQTGFLNGVAIALTTSLGVYWWSKSMGLAMVIASSMVLAMIAAGIAGALVPITLKRFGQDPAQSSSIILTTVTDVAGFFSFLGIATLLAQWLA